MKLIFNIKQYLNFEKIIPYSLVLILSLLCLRISMIQQATGAESQDEPHISLKVKNQPLGNVLKKITQDTGFKFSLNAQWHVYPVNVSIENMPLHRGLKLILQGLNHAIIYETDQSIKIVVYGEKNSRSTDASPIRPFSSQIQDSQPEPSPSPESALEEADDLKREDDRSEETESSDTAEDSSTENEDPSDSQKEESSEETGTAQGKELDEDSSGQRENTDQQNEQENATEDAPPESP